MKKRPIPAPATPMSLVVPRQRASARRDWRPAFLAAYEETGVVLTAAKAAQVTARTVHREKAKDTDFAVEFEEARRAGALLLEEEATRRAVQGVRRFKFYEGRMIMVPTGKTVRNDAGETVPEMTPYVEHEYSDQLLITLLKRHFPNEYRENSKVEHSGGVKIVRLPAKEVEEP